MAIARVLFWIISILAFLLLGVLVAFVDHKYFYHLCYLVPLFFIGLYDMWQKKKTILRLYPIVGHLRIILLSIRPQIQQYFIETDQNGMPFSREEREMVYERAKQTLDTLPFGTERDVHAFGFDSINHSIMPVVTSHEEARLIVGGPQCSKKYDASRLNISAMSFGAISKNAILALNRGAKMGNFAHNTGEGGLSPYHLAEGGDIIWQIASGYFGCRDKKGHFDPVLFQEKAQLDNVKMIEIKLSQGAKPGHGGILPAVKVSPEIAAVRGVEIGQDCVSPARHSAFSTPIELLSFIVKLRELSGGKPVGFKLCVGHRKNFYGICKAMLETGIYPDFITVDGAEGGTGAAPVEFVDFVGVPLNEGLVFVRNALVGTGLKEHIRIIASGKIISGFDLVCKMAMGADMCNSARGMMFALGCLQSRRCNKNTCPTGVATQEPVRVAALDVNDKAPRVLHFHDATINSFLELLGAAGIKKVSELTPNYVYRRVGIGVVKHYDEIFPFFEKDQLLKGENLPPDIATAWHEARSDQF
ncbi:MAG: FMN-binding glutamate synthase family protein [Gammaproteobacteria bacterium]